MIKGKLVGINKFNSKKGNTICILNVQTEYPVNQKNAIGFEFSKGIAFGDEADSIYDIVTKNKLINENVNIGGLKDDNNTLIVHDIEKAK